MALRGEFFLAFFVSVALNVAATTVRCETAAQQPLTGTQRLNGDDPSLRSKPTPEQSLSTQAAKDSPLNFCNDLIHHAGLDEDLFHVPQYQTCLKKSGSEPLPNLQTSGRQQPGDTTEVPGTPYERTRST